MRLLAAVLSALVMLLLMLLAAWGCVAVADQIAGMLSA